MTNNMNLMIALPEIILMVSASIILLVDMFLRDARRRLTYGLSMLVLIVCGLVSAYHYYNEPAVIHSFHKLFVLDPMASLLKLFSVLAVGLTLLYARRYVSDRGMTGSNSPLASENGLGGEFYVLALFALLGQMVMISGANLLIIYLGLELLSLSLYALVALRRDDAGATEAAMKFFILGALASGFLLYGMSMLYGATGSLDLQTMAQAIAGGSIDQTVLIFGIVFLVAGLAFKLGAAPFHMWVPDVYHGAPTPVTLLIGGAPKFAAFAICLRLLVEGLSPMAASWQQMLMVLAVFSMAIGNITALVQTNLKRMLAYSSVAHMGFMLLGLLSGIAHGDMTPAVNAYSSAMFYVLAYVLATLGAFGIILLMARAGFEADTLDDFKGLNQRSPWFAFVMMLVMFSLAGLPPLIGFYAKLAVLQALLAVGHIGLAIVAVLLSLVGAYYYLRVVKLMYFDAPATEEKIEAAPDLRLVLGANGLLLLLLGLMPGPLMDACARAVATALGS
jgi:NADH-quinone oxidoreductase subunit N